MRDQLMAVGDPVRPDLPGDARPHDLLGSAGADLQESLERFAINPRPRQSVQLSNNFI